MIKRYLVSLDWPQQYVAVSIGIKISDKCTNGYAQLKFFFYRFASKK